MEAATKGKTASKRKHRSIKEVLVQKCKASGKHARNTSASAEPPAAKQGRTNDAETDNSDEVDVGEDVRKLSEFVKNIAESYSATLKDDLTALGTNLQRQEVSFTALESMQDTSRRDFLSHFSGNMAVAIILDSAFKTRNTCCLRRASIRLAYDGESTRPLPKSFEKLGAKFVVTNHEANDRDKLYNPHGKLILTAGVVELLRYFWDHMDRDTEAANNIQELCIGGASGVGKSCAVRLLAGDIIRRKPLWDVYYIREYRRGEHDSEVARRIGKVDTPTYLIVDEIKSSDDARSLGAFANNPLISVILVSSGNVPHFQERRAGIQHSKMAIYFQFSASFEDCMCLRRALLNVSFVAAGRRPQPRETLLTRDNLRRRNHESLSMFDKYRFVNGNFLLMAQLFFKRSTTIDAKLKDTGRLMSEFFREHSLLYLAVVDMFQHSCGGRSRVARVRMTETEMRHHLDYRFLSPEGIVRAPIFLQAFHSVVRNEKPPIDAWDNTANGDFMFNPSVEGFVLERECLQGDRLTHVGRKCVEAFEFWGGMSKSFRERRLRTMFRNTPLRVSFENVKDLSEQISKNILGVDHDESWAVHAIPDVWAYKAVDGVLIYFLFDACHPTATAEHHLFIIGNQITTKPLCEHAESLAWLGGEAEQLVETLLGGGVSQVTAHVALLFTCKMGGERTVETSLKLRAGSKVLQYPLVAAVSHTCRRRRTRYFSDCWETSSGVAAIREVTITNV